MISLLNAPFLFPSRQVAKATDIRVRLINEILHGIRIVKYLGFERTFAERVRVNRAEELEKIRK